MRDWLIWFALGSFAILPYSFVYDMVIFQAVLAFWRNDPECLFGLKTQKAAEWLWIFSWMLPFASTVIAGAAAIQITPLFLLFML